MRTIQEEAFVILDGALLPIDRIAADTPCCPGERERHGMNVQVLTDPLGRLLRASPALPGSAHDSTAAIIEALTEAVLRCRADKAHQGAGGPRPRTVSGPAPQAVAAPSQRHPRQDPLSRWAGHGLPQRVAPSAEAPLQHQPNHRRREGRPHSSPRLNVRLEKAQ